MARRIRDATKGLPLPPGRGRRTWGNGPLGDDDLTNVGEQGLPSPLIAEWIVALTKYREERKSGEWARERARVPVVQSVAVPGVTHVAVEGAPASRPHSSPKGLAAPRVEVAADSEGGPRQPGNEARQHIDLFRDPVADDRQHGSQGRTRRSPPECIHRHDAANSIGRPGNPGQPCRPAEVVRHERDLDRRRPGPFTLQVLKPEVAIVALSSFAFFVEWRRRHGSAEDAREWRAPGVQPERP